MRQLVTLRTIGAIHPIEKADAIEEVTVDGWSLVCQKGIHSVGDSVLFFEIDCFLPSEDPRFDTFMKFGMNTLEGRKGHRVRTKRLRGVYSQGIIMPPSLFPEIMDLGPLVEDFCYAEAVGVIKYERPEVTGFQGNQKKGGLDNWPWFLRKSDQNRIQNVYKKLVRDFGEEYFIADLKMDGSSITVFNIEEDMDEAFGDKGDRVCSRNIELDYKMDEDPTEQGNFIHGAHNADLFNKVRKLQELTGKRLAIQGELVGAGIQGGFEKFDNYTVFAYNIFDIKEGEFVDYTTFTEYARMVDLQIVPQVCLAARFLELLELPELLAMADGKGLRAPYREGLVFKSLTSNKQFKVISNKYLNKEK